MTPPTASVAEGARPPHHVEIERVYVWDLVVRTSHWVIMVSLLLLTVTAGFALGLLVALVGRRRARK